MRFKIRCFGKALLALAAIAALGYVVERLWNAIVPAAFSGAHALDYWHALGLLALSRILFGGFRGRGHSGDRRWERFGSMTRREREQFRRSTSGEAAGNLENPQ